MTGVRITRASDAPSYSPPLHEGVRAVRLQGHEAGPTDAFWVGRSTYPPGSTAQQAPTAAETVYVCLAGELRLTSDAGASTLRAGDSAHLPPGTIRSVVNASADDAELLVVIAQTRPS